MQKRINFRCENLIIIKKRVLESTPIPSYVHIDGN